MKHCIAPSLATLAFLSGCSHDFLVSTDPPGALVSVNGNAVGPTPAELTSDLLESSSPNGYLVLRISKQGYDTLNLALPANPSNDRITIALKPFRDAVAKAPVTAAPLKRDKLERDLSVLMRQQGRLILGQDVKALNLANWRAQYPASGAAPFLEALRFYQQGKKPECRALLDEAMRRNDHEIDYRAVASAIDEAGE